ncbi:sensor histidine kinase [Heyndrickxia sporothermodurans]
MNYIIKSIVLFYFVYERLMDGEKISYYQFSVLLMIIALTILKERFFDSKYITFISVIILCLGTTMDVRFTVLFALPFYDFMLKRFYLGIFVVLCCFLFFTFTSSLELQNIIILLLSGLLAFDEKKAKSEQLRYEEALDNERRLRYELEQTKIKLLQSSKEIATIAEVKERNRIAQDIHDSIGHRIAGILMQLQAAYKVHSIDQEKSRHLVNQSVKSLADSIELIRNTVYNIKPRENVGVKYIESIVDNFCFCPVKLNITGDFNSISAEHIEIISTNLKEALTNSSKYSEATKMEVMIDVTDQYIRLYMKDNGVGCPSIKEGIGLSGMKERLRNVGGSISFSTNDGFLIVCLIPKHERSGFFESAYRR